MKPYEPPQSSAPHDGFEADGLKPKRSPGDRAVEVTLIVVFVLFLIAIANALRL